MMLRSLRPGERPGARKRALGAAARIARAARGVEPRLVQAGALALLPGGALLAHGAGGLAAMTVVAALGPVAALLALRAGERAAPAHPERCGLTGLVLRAGVAARLDEALAGAGDGGRTTACLVIEIDAFRRTADHLGMALADEVLRRVGERLALTCRAGDAVGRLGGAAFAVALGPVPRVDLEAVLHLAERLQAAVAEPLPTAGGTVHLTASVGFCLPARAPRSGGAAMIEAAERASAEARRAGPGALRSYCEEIGRRAQARHALVGGAAEALERGWIVPHFQPQLSLGTGRITGVEALARWCDPERGVLPPGEFLPALEQAGLLGRLGETMLHQSLQALRAWDRAGLAIPSVAVNFSGDELRNPALAERIRWVLDGFELTPDRLTVEVLETVVAGQGDDVIVRNLHRLAETGCRIDLDDFGTGHASIGAIRRFPVSRVKIDRSFVAGIEEDPEQHRMVAAILGMAERLGLDTLAEGVETAGQHAQLAQLACGHVQGFGIARPMPLEDFGIWAARREARHEAPPLLTRRAG